LGRLRRRGGAPVQGVRAGKKTKGYVVALRKNDCFGRTRRLTQSTYIEEVQFVRIGSSDTRSEKQQITLQPFHLERRKLESDAGT
jgi:hypothetical protein